MIKEAFLNFREKLSISKSKNVSSIITYEEYESFLIYLTEKEDIYHSYYFFLLGLNYSLISRILFKDIKVNFTFLMLRKGIKILKHKFPPIIS